MPAKAPDIGGRRVIILTVLGGLIAGIVGSLGVNLWLGRGDQPSNARLEEPIEIARSPDGDQDRAKFVAAAFALKMAAASGQGGRDDRAGGERSPPTAENLPQLFRDFVAAHEREVTSPSWAKTTKAGLSRDLEGLAKTAHFSRFELDCRSKTCSGFIEWPSQDDARRNLPLILQHRYGINSGVRFLLPDDPSAATCRVSVLFEPQVNEVRPILE